jgi:hypothetical protein
MILPVVPPTALIEGKTYGQWSEEWWRWAYSLPVNHHPLFDNAPASAGQSGWVWFLGGNFTGTPAVRTATVPAGKALFFAILDAQQDDTDCDGDRRIADPLTEAQLRANVKALMDSAHDLRCTLDGVAIPGLAERYRAASATPGGFSYTQPGLNNFLSNFGYPCWSNSNGDPVFVDAPIYHPVADGYYVMLEPLSVGEHTLHFSGELGNPMTFAQDVTYHLTVNVVAEQPVITHTHSGHSIAISWNLSGFTLEASDTLGAAANWSAVPGGSSSPVLVDASSGTKFYRLRK